MTSRLQTSAAALGLAVMMIGCTPREGGGGPSFLEGVVGAADPTGYGVSGLRVGQAAAKVKESDELTPQQHYYLGRAVTANLLSQYSLYEDDAATRYVTQIGTALAAASDMPYVYNGYRFAILDSAEVNAFAVPGAYVLITRGMLRCCETEDQLAAVLAHEIAHIQRQHALQAIKQSRWGDLAKVAASEGAGHAAGQSGLPIGEVARVFTDAAGDMTKNLMVNGYSRKAEAEADADAVVILQRVGYDPHALTAMLDRMGQRVSPGSSGFGKTHPPASARVKSVQTMIKTPPVEPPAVRQQRFDQALAQAIGQG